MRYSIFRTDRCRIQQMSPTWRNSKIPIASPFFIWIVNPVSNQWRSLPICVGPGFANPIVQRIRLTKMIGFIPLWFWIRMFDPDTSFLISFRICIFVCFSVCFRIRHFWSWFVPFPTSFQIRIFRPFSIYFRLHTFCSFRSILDLISNPLLFDRSPNFRIPYNFAIRLQIGTIRPSSFAQWFRSLFNSVLLSITRRSFCVDFGPLLFPMPWLVGQPSSLDWWSGFEFQLNYGYQNVRPGSNVGLHNKIASTNRPL